MCHLWPNWKLSLHRLQHKCNAYQLIIVLKSATKKTNINARTLTYSVEKERERFFTFALTNRLLNFNTHFFYMCIFSIFTTFYDQQLFIKLKYTYSGAQWKEFVDLEDKSGLALVNYDKLHNPIKKIPKNSDLSLQKFGYSFKPSTGMVLKFHSCLWFIHFCF